MEKEILSALKEKFGDVQEAILTKMAAKLAAAGKTAEDAKNVTFQQLLESYGDSRATDATKTAVLNYEKKHNLKDGKPVEVTPPEPPAPLAGNNEENNIPEWAKALIESNKALKERVEAMNGEKKEAERRQQLESVLGALPEGLRKGYERIRLDNMEDEAFGNLINEVKAEVEDISKSVQAKGAVFGRPTSNLGTPTSGEATKEEVDRILDRMNINNL